MIKTLTNKLFTLLVVLLLGGPTVAIAVPVGYDVTYSAAQGPSGVGSFSFDNATGLITNYSWNFGGVTGGLSDSTFSEIVFGDTLGRFVFEMLSQTDVHSGANCIAPGSCGLGATIGVGSGPLDSTEFHLNVPAALPVMYDFTDTTGNIILDAGSVSIAAVPEPSTYAMLLAGLGLLGFVVHRRKLNALAA